MEEKNSLTVSLVQFYAYKADEKGDLVFIDQFPFDNRHDFLVNSGFAGIAVRLELCGSRDCADMHREVSVSVIDLTLRREAACRNVSVDIRAEDPYKDVFLCFDSETAAFAGGHTYRVIVCDETASEVLTEEIIHLFDGSFAGHPAEWFEVTDGGVRPAWEGDLYKSLDTIDDHDYYVRFNLAQRFGTLPPRILPELECRLYYPDGRRVISDFREPRCHGRENYIRNNWYVEYPFATTSGINGAFYAELLCMEYPIAGFVFATDSADECGSWFGAEIEPLERYSPCAVADRLESLAREAETDEFDEALDRFIEAEKTSLGLKPDEDAS